MITAQEPWPHPTLQVLSLDGGGLKGLFSAAVLAELERDHMVRLIDHFDLIVGTSTGGLIALGLGAGLTPEEIVDFYVREGDGIFPRTPGRGARQFFRAKYGNAQLRASLNKILGERRLGDSNKRLVIPSYSLDMDNVYLFKTPHHPGLRRDGRELMVDVALATSAAPTYLPASTLRHHRLIDGGVWANNPTLVGVTEASSVLGAPLAAIRVLSLGTTDAVVSNPKRLNRGGFAQWGKPLSRVLLSAQSHGAVNMTKHLLGEDRLLRLDAQVPDREFQLDRLNHGRIRGLAGGVSRPFNHAVEPFLEHRAAPYVPQGPSAD